jgi:putative DNA modification/repair radical SAM protein
MNRLEKLRLLADAARYDASCAASGVQARRAGDGDDRTLGIVESVGADGRRLALLKVLLSNECIFDCGYCAHRRSNDIERASFTTDEVIELTVEYHARGMIDGLFLSSGVAGSPDETMSRLVEVARRLRRERHYFGYIHLKTIPDCSSELVDEAGRWADRLSVNIELPRREDLARLAPEKSLVQITRAMGRIRDGIVEARESHDDELDRAGSARRFAPAGQTTQMIVGATAATDADILLTASTLYARQGLRRVYYSAFQPVEGGDASLPRVSPSLLRERRLYEADWLIRQYGFTAGDLTPPGAENLDLAIDPKLAWALRHRDRFPVDVNRASRFELLRVPGLGARSVERIVDARRRGRLALADLGRMHVAVRRVLPFVEAADHRPRGITPDVVDLRERLARAPQLELFGDGTEAAG